VQATKQAAIAPQAVPFQPQQAGPPQHQQFQAILVQLQLANPGRTMQEYQQYAQQIVLQQQLQFQEVLAQVQQANPGRTMQEYQQFAQQIMMQQQQQPQQQQPQKQQPQQLQPQPVEIQAPAALQIPMVQVEVPVYGGGGSATVIYEGQLISVQIPAGAQGRSKMMVPVPAEYLSRSGQMKPVWDMSH
jgi:hypothetical protein